MMTSPAPEAAGGFPARLGGLWLLNWGAAVKRALERLWAEGDQERERNSIDSNGVSGGGRYGGGWRRSWSILLERKEERDLGFYLKGRES